MTPGDTPPEPIFAAAYVRMSTEHQQYSTSNQMDVIREYAKCRGMQIIKEYSDEGKSGLNIQGRDSLAQMIKDVQGGEVKHSSILVYDVSRWGRFQDADESAYYEYICRQAGVAVHYCAEQFENDGSPVSTIVKGVKRAMAGEYSRELSSKVFQGACRLIQLGYKQGGTAGFGLRRMLVDQNGQHKAMLKICVQPLKQYLRPGGRENEFEQGRLICMPACINVDGRILGVKLITGFPRNVRYGLSRASGLVVLFDPVTGFPIAVMDCATLSARRTGAVAAVCFTHFGSRDETVAIIGAGPISREVILALNAGARRVSRFRLYDLNRERAENLRMAVAWQLQCEIRVSFDLELCLRGATTVIAATTGSKEYIDPAHLDACRLMVPLSLDDFRAETLLSADKLVVDEFDGCAREEKLFHRLVRDGRLTPDKVYAELGQVVAGMKPGRTGNERVFANLMGMGCEDIAAAKAVYDKILENEALDGENNNNGNSLWKQTRTIPTTQSSWWR